LYGHKRHNSRTEPDGERRVKLSPRVLIVDASRESREVLRMLLELRGATTIEASDPEQALQLTNTVRPDLIVLDTDSDSTASGEPTNDLREAANRNHTPIVILGKVRQLHGNLESGQIMTKPYHYGPLIRKIDGLLAAA
jgi:DNA-binding response OmpR family regulator